MPSAMHLEQPIRIRLILPQSPLPEADWLVWPLDAPLPKPGFA